MARPVTEQALRMRIEVWKGAAALARLESPLLREQWDRLYADCPWA